MSNQILHTGVITAAGHGNVTVRLASDPGKCGGCAIASLCGKPQLVEVSCQQASPELVGRRATLAFSEANRYKAIALFLGCPVALLIVSTIICAALETSDAVTAAAALGAVAAWFAALFLFRGKLNKKTVVTILKIE